MAEMVVMVLVTLVTLGITGVGSNRWPVSVMGSCHGGRARGRCC